MSDESPEVDERTSDEFKDVIGVQVYTNQKLVLSSFPNVVESDPYDDEILKKLLADKGVVFYRDSINAHGIILVPNFVGTSFYSQFYIHPETGCIGRIFKENEERMVVGITPMTVCWDAVKQED